MSFEWNKTYELVGVVEDSNGKAEKLIFDEKTTFTSSEESEDDEASVDVTDKPEQESGHDEESGEEESDDEVEVTDKPKQDVPVSENKPEAQSKEEEEQSEEEEEDEEEEDEDEDEDEEGEEEVESDSDDEVEETEINGKMYFTNDEKNGIIYEQDMEGDVGKKVGRFRNGVAVFNK